MRKLISLSLLCLSPLIAYADWSLQELTEEIRPVKQRTARFTETKESFLLDTALIQTGTLSFRAPTLLRKEIKEPKPLLMMIDGDELTVSAQDQPTRHLFLRDHPLLLAFTESYRALLAGEQETLEFHYNTEMTGSRENWNLRLTPRNETLGQLIVSVEFFGSDTEIQSIVTTEFDGDRTITKLIPINGSEK